MQKAWFFLRLGRPIFLGGGVVLYLLGVVIALYGGARLDLAALIWGQVTVTSIQWMTHYSNEYFDLEGDRQNRAPTAWSGGSQVLAAGHLPPWVAMAAALGLAAVALVAIAVLSVRVRPGWPTLALLGAAFVAAWGYSAPPAKLHSRGLGELAVVLLVSGLTPQIGFYLQAGRLAVLPLLASVPLCALQLGMIVSVALPDMESDAAVGKRTLVVRLGRPGAARLVLAALLAAYALLPLLVLAGLPAAVAAAALLGLPLAGWQAWRLWRGDWAVAHRWSGLVFRSVLLLAGTSVLELLAFAWLCAR